MESGLAEPGWGSTPAISLRRASGSASRGAVAVADVGPDMGSDIEAELSLVTQDALRSEDDQQHQCDTDDDEGELAGLLAVHDVDVVVGGQVGVGDPDDRDPAHPEDQRAEHGSPDGGRP